MTGTDQNPCTCPDYGGPWESGWDGVPEVDACCRWHGQAEWRRDDTTEEAALYRALMPLADSDDPQMPPAILAFHPRALAHRLAERLDELHYEIRYVGPGGA